MPRALSVALLAALALALAAAPPPDDPLVSQQWHLDRVRVYEAWDGPEGGRGDDVVVAVLDTGVDLDHPDLEGRLVDGVDLVDRDTPPDDPEGHGTIVAGTVAAVAGNGRGVAGVAPLARVMPVRVLDEDGQGTSMEVAEGIRWAVDHGARVVNLSLAETDPESEGLSVLVDRRVERAIEEAAEAGVLVVAAAGNGGLETVPFDEDIPVLVVGASDRHDRVWEMSNRDQRTLFAPGVEILATWSDARYAKSDGTSFAAPVVAAGAAMLMAHGMEAEDVRERLVSTAVDIGAGLGRVDLAAAAGVTDQPPPIATPPPTTPPPADPPPTEAQPPGSAPPPGQPTAMPATPVPVEPVPVTEPEPAPPQASPTPPPPVASPTPPPVLTPGPLSSSTPPAAAVPPEPTAALPAEPDPLPVERVPGGGLPGGARAGVVVAVAVLVVDVAALGAWLVARRRAGAGP